MFSRFGCQAVATLAVFVLAACSTQDSSKTGTRDSLRATNTAAATTVQPLASAGPNVVTIVAKEFSFEAPAQIPAGLTTIRLVSHGRELHHAALIKLEDGKTFDDFTKATKNPAAPPPKWAVDFGGPNPPVPNGTASEVTEVLPPGQYVIVCFVPSPDGVPHFAKGMMRPLTVTAVTTASATPEPTADLTMTLSDYTFTLSKPLSSGKHVIRVENLASQSHELILAKLAPGKTVEDLSAWIDKMVGPPPGMPVGGVAAIHQGGHAYVTVDLPPGDYALLCEVPDAKDGKPHVAHGMMKQIKVT